MRKCLGALTLALSKTKHADLFSTASHDSVSFVDFKFIFYLHGLNYQILISNELINCKVKMGRLSATNGVIMYVEWFFGW